MNNTFNQNIFSQVASDLLLLVKTLNLDKSRLTYKAACELLMVQKILNSSSNSAIGCKNLFPRKQKDGSFNFSFNEEIIMINPNKEYIATEPTNLELVWLGNFDSSNFRWKQTFNTFYKYLFSINSLNEKDLYYITHIVFFFTDFGQKKKKKTKELILCRKILMDFLLSKNENLDLRLEATLAISLIDNRFYYSNDFFIAKERYKEFNFVSPSLNKNEKKSIYGVFHSTAVYFILLIVEQKLKNKFDTNTKANIA